MPDDETAHGPFDSREDAIDDAQDELGCGSTVLLGRCAWLSVSGYGSAAVCVDEVLETMSECASDNGEGPPDDPAFSISEGRIAEARRALEAAVEEWAREYVEAKRWYQMRDEESFTIVVGWDAKEKAP